MQLRFIGEYPKYEVLRTNNPLIYQEETIGHIRLNRETNLLEFRLTTFHNLPPDVILRNLPSDERNQIINFIQAHDNNLLQQQIADITNSPNQITLEFID